MNLIDAIILGIIQGLTEFLPVSSSGHLELGSALLGTASEENLLFTVIVHAATALSTIIVFRNDILQIIKDLFRFEWNDSTRFVVYIILSMIPIMIVGLGFKDQVESLFGGNIMLVGINLMVTGLLLSFTFFYKPKEGELNGWKAFVIGIAQSIAVLPGISRSGSTIATALLLGVNRETAARFSFLMVLVPILGVSALDFKDYLETPAIAGGISSTALIAGFVAAFLSGLLACTWMINLVKRGKLIYFAIYCFIVGLVAISLSF